MNTVPSYSTSNTFLCNVSLHRDHLTEHIRVLTAHFVKQLYVLGGTIIIIMGSIPMHILG